MPVGYRSTQRGMADHFDDQPGSVVSYHFHVDNPAGRVFARVGQPLLDDAVGGTRKRGRKRFGFRHVDSRSNRHACSARLFEEAGQLRECRLGRQSCLVGFLTEKGNDTAQLLECGGGRGSDHGGGLRDLLPRCVRPELQRAGVDAEQGETVGENVVHLAREPAALGLTRLFDRALLLGLQLLWRPRSSGCRSRALPRKLPPAGPRPSGSVLRPAPRGPHQ
jgi:hypothetical protein